MNRSPRISKYAEEKRTEQNLLIVRSGKSESGSN